MPFHAAQTARDRARVTVITRTRDRPMLLGRCLRSVLGQSFRDWLHVIVNDGGNPRLLHLLVAEHAAEYAGRIEVIDLPGCQGMQQAANRGLEAAGGEFVAIHDDDDSWESDFLRSCVNYLDEAGADNAVQGVITHTTRVLEEFRADGTLEELGREDYLPVKSVELFAVCSDNAFAPIAFVYRRVVHQHLGPFDGRFNVVGDWDFNLRFLARHEIGVIPRRLANYHWRHRSGGTVYANTVTDAREEHARKSAELRNHHLRQDLQAGRLGLGYLLNTARYFRGHSHLLWEARSRGDQAIHEVQKVQGRLRRWEWFFTRNPKLKPAAPGVELHHQAQKNGHAEVPRARSCREQPAAVFSDGNPPPTVLSLDIFDTALLRLVRQPADAFLLLVPAVCQALATEANFPFGELRVAAERTARTRRFAAAGHQEVSLSEIYEVFCELAGVDAALHRERLSELEMGVEAALLYPDPAILATAAAAERAGTRVVFVSDMYLPPGFLVSQLRRAGYSVNKGALFLSSEHGASKHEGGLFDRVLDACGCPPGEIIHVGDNFHSDVERAAERGIRTIHWQAAPAPAADRTALVDQRKDDAPQPAFSNGDLLSSLCTGLARRSRITQIWEKEDASRQPAMTGADDPLWDRFGYEVGGPLYLTFSSWLLRQARREGRGRLFFLARDGHYLRQACALLAANAKLPIEAVEMAASRRLLNLPQVTKLDHAAWQFLLTPNPNLSVRHFLTRLGLQPEPLGDFVRRAGFATLDEVVTTPGGVFRSETDHRAMRALLLSLEPVILGQAAAERGCLQRYFARVGFVPEEADKLAVVDLGWQASSARALQTLWTLRSNEAGRPHGTLRAFYFGTWQLAQTALDAGCDLSSFFFHLGEPARKRSLVSEAVELIELFFGAPHPTIVGLRENPDGNMEPLYGEHELGEAHRRRVARMRERAVEFVRDAAALAPAGEWLDWPGNGFGYLEAVLERCLRHPSAHEARVLGALAARDSFGGGSPSRPLAQPPGRWERLIHPGRLRQAYQHAFWKRGFLAQLPPREAARLQAAG